MGTATAYALGRHAVPGSAPGPDPLPRAVDHSVRRPRPGALATVLAAPPARQRAVDRHRARRHRPAVRRPPHPAGFALLSRSVEEAAVTLGANRRGDVLPHHRPLIKRNLVAAWVFAFIVSFDEFVVAYFLSGPALDDATRQDVRDAERPRRSRHLRPVHADRAGGRGRDPPVPGVRRVEPTRTRDSRDGPIGSPPARGASP